METLTRNEFARLPAETHVDGEITFQHGPKFADIHHDIKDASVTYALALYPSFDSIQVVRLKRDDVRYKF